MCQQVPDFSVCRLGTGVVLFRKKSDTVAHTYASPVLPVLLMGRALTFPSYSVSVTSAWRWSGMCCSAGMSQEEEHSSVLPAVPGCLSSHIFPAGSWE